MARLTPREEQVLALIGRTMNCRRIGAELGIAAFTVRKHRTSIIRKLGLRSTADLTAYAIAALPRQPPARAEFQLVLSPFRNIAAARD